MSAKPRTTAGGTGYGSGLWPVLLSLLVVLIPTACVLWFLSEAVQNERLAARQRLAEAYRGYLPMLRNRLETYWQQQAATLDATAGKSRGPAAFAACVGAAVADSVVCYDSQGRLAYPAPAVKPQDRTAEDAAWEDARLLEYARNEPAAAAAAYAGIASKASDDTLAARALQAQARCLARAGRVDDAIRVLAETLGQGRFARVLDAEGRLLVADAELRALELLGDPGSPLKKSATGFASAEFSSTSTHWQSQWHTKSLFQQPAGRPAFQQVAARLARCLADYRTPTLPAAQRRFLMKELRRLAPEAAVFPTLAAEELAAAYLEAPRPSAQGVVQPSGLPEVWHFASPSGRVVALLRGRSILERTAALMAADALPPEVQIALAPPDAEAAENVEQVLAAGPRMPGWRLVLTLRHGQPSDAASERQVAVYVWIAILVIAVMSIVAVIVARALRRQMRLTRLKNDLLATVSHELKTPLSSIRLLVDTLLDAKQLDAAKTREYLQLVATENVRLSRLIDNFLSFSRLERGKQVFEFAAVPAAEIAQRAVAAAGERFRVPACRLEVETAADVPAVSADGDALVTAVVNLLDNAYKYSADGRHIVLRTYAENGSVCFAVRDNGIGLPPRAVRRVFRPFYQVDRRLSRGVGGCGLGLSIVKFIVAAHGGTIRVESCLGQGSTFTIAIPSGPSQ